MSHLLSGHRCLEPPCRWLRLPSISVAISDPGVSCLARKTTHPSTCSCHSSLASLQMGCSFSHIPRVSPTRLASSEVTRMFPATHLATAESWYVGSANSLSSSKHSVKPKTYLEGRPQMLFLHNCIFWDTVHTVYWPLCIHTEGRKWRWSHKITSPGDIIAI